MQRTDSGTNGQDELAGKLESITSGICALADELEQVAGQLLDETERERIWAAVDRLRSRGLYAVVCGEFKRGKSSLLNALLRQRDVFPVDEDIATSIVTAVAYGDREEARVFLRGQDAAREVDIAAVREYVTESGNPGNAQQVQLVDIRGPFAALAPGITLIDTPGEGSLNVEHTAATLAFLPYADAVIVVVDAVEPVTTKELEFVDVVRRSTTNMIFAVTKLDLAVEPETMVGNLRAKLCGRYGEEGARIPIVAVSSTRVLDGVDEGDPQLIDDSGFPQLEDQLWHVLLRRAAATAVLETTSELRRAIEHVVVPLRSQLIAITEKPALTARLRRKLEATSSQLDDAAQPGAAWRQQLGDFLGQLGATVLNDFETSVARITDELHNVWLQSPDLLSCPEEIAKNLVSSLVLRVNVATEQLRDGLCLAYAQIDDELQLDVARKDLDAISFDPGLLEIPNAVLRPKGLWSRARSYLRSHWDSGGMRDLLRGIAGATVVVLGVLGSARGGRLGGLTRCSGEIVNAASSIRSGIRNIQDTDVATRVNELSAVLEHYLVLNARRTHDALHDVVSRLPYSVVGEFEQHIADERRMVTESLNRLDTSTGQVDITRQAALQRQVDELAQLHSQLDGFDAKVLGDAATRPPGASDDTVMDTAIAKSPLANTTSDKGFAAGRPNRK